jgi:prepilin-type N-terminal cleavage/methylation domain-containing protein
MNNKGFTLVELMVTLVLIGLMSTIILVNVVGLQSKTEDQSYNAFVAKIEAAASAYIDEQQNTYLREACFNVKDGCNISLKTLIEEGLIDADLKDPQDNSHVKENHCVNIKWEQDGSANYKKKVCTYKTNNC